MATTVLGHATAAHADCVRWTTQDAQCSEEYCVLYFATLHPAEGDPVVRMVNDATGASVDLESRDLGDEGVLVRAPGPLGRGSWSLVMDEVPAHVRVEVGERPPPFSRVRALGEFRAVQGCGDSFLAFPRPRLALEENFVVSVRLGRTPLPNTTAAIWLLQPGEPVPAGMTDGFFPPPRAPDIQRRHNAMEPRALCAACGTPDAYDVHIHFTELGGADRVAIQVMETAGEHTDVLVVPLDDQRKPYATCACSTPRAGHAAWSAWVFVAAMLAARRSTRACATLRPWA